VKRKGKRPLRVWFHGEWDPHKDPEHVVKAVVRYPPHTKVGRIVSKQLQGIALLLEAYHKGEISGEGGAR
jgi:hypothetical protein